jgi:tetratricopeptide (TPR) repeat protein
MRKDGLCDEDKNLTEDDIKKVVTILTEKIENGNLDAEALAMTYYNRGCAYSTLEDYDNALVDYSNAISHNQKLWETYYNRGNIYFSRCEYDKAINDYTKSTDINSNDYSVYYNRGLAYQNIGHYKSALADYRRVLSINPDHKYTQISIDNIINLV